MMQASNPAWHRQRGFTLIEAIIAIIVIGTTMPAMLWALGQASMDRVSPVQASTARWLAMEKLEDVLADRSDVDRGYTYIVASNYPDESSVSGFTDYARSVAIVETDASFTPGGTGVKKVKVTVSWVHHDGQTHSVSLSTVVTDSSQ